MNDRIAEIWFSCFPLASENFKSMPAAAAASWMFFELAVRHPLSAPTWEKPMVTLPSAEPPGAGPLPQPTTVAAISAPSAAARVLFTATPHLSVVELGRYGPGRHGFALHLHCDRRYSAWMLALTMKGCQRLDRDANPGRGAASSSARNLPTHLFSAL